MKSTIVLAVMAAAVFTLTASDSFAEPKRASREQMLRKCEQRGLRCEQKCDENQPNMTDKEYKSCNDGCDDKVKYCRRRVDEINPARTGGSGGSDSGGGLLLSPD